MTIQKPTRPREFAADIVNAVKANLVGVSTLPDGAPRNLSFEQAVAVSQVQALNAIAASLLALTDAITEQNAR